MESIDKSNLNQDDYSKAKNEYLKIKWKIVFKDYKDKNEEKELLKQKDKLEKEWEFTEEQEENL